MKRKPEKTIFSERVHELRREHILTMEQLSVKFRERYPDIKLNTSTISRYEHGMQEPQMSTVVALASFFGVSPAYLTGDSDDRDALLIEKREVSDEESEVLRLFEALSMRNRTKLLAYGYELEERQLRGEDPR